MRLLDNWENSAECWEVMEDIITLRASFLIDRVITGLAIDFDKALDLLRNHNDFTTEREKQQRDTLVAAIDNLVDFAAAQEYAMMLDIPKELEYAIEEYDDICLQYNLRGALAENEDVLYAAGVAAWWLDISTETLITYMTMGDERVRPWHEALEGLSYPKHDFPVELIPPIEWGCRCFLVAEGYSTVMGALEKKDFSGMVHPVFKESLAAGGRIFSDEHPYFKNPLPPQLQKVKEKIKQKFFAA